MKNWVENLVSWWKYPSIVVDRGDSVYLTEPNYHRVKIINGSVGTSRTTSIRHLYLVQGQFIGNSEQGNMIKEETNEKSCLITRQVTPGGNIMFSPGAGMPSGSIMFNLPESGTFMEIRSDGKCLVRGEIVEDNKSIYFNFRRWMQLAHIIPPEI